MGGQGPDDARTHLSQLRRLAPFGLSPVASPGQRLAHPLSCPAFLSRLSFPAGPPRRPGARKVPDCCRVSRRAWRWRTGECEPSRGTGGFGRGSPGRLRPDGRRDRGRRDRGRRDRTGPLRHADQDRPAPGLPAGVADGGGHHTSGGGHADPGRGRGPVRGADPAQLGVWRAGGGSRPGHDPAGGRADLRRLRGPGRQRVRRGPDRLPAPPGGTGHALPQLALDRRKPGGLPPAAAGATVRAGQPRHPAPAAVGHRAVGLRHPRHPERR
jgi:hypothetical protein